MPAPRSFLAIAFSVLLITPAAAVDWVQHKFGELRAYHGDWLNVCTKDGKGDCRTVQIPLKAGDDPFFGESQLTLHVAPEGSYQIEFFQRNLIADRDMYIGFCFDDFCSGTDGPTTWRPGSKGAENVAETIIFTDAELSKLMVERMIKNNRLEIVYGPNDASKRAKFSLRGVTAALKAIEKHYQMRNTQ